MDHAVADRLVRALAEHDRAGLLELLAPDVDFRGLTPGRAWEASSAPEVVSVLLDHWFEDKDEVEAVLRVEHGDDVEGLRRVAYRFALVNPSGSFTAEQQAYHRVEGGRLTYLRVLCSGFRPREAAEARPPGSGDGPRTA
ncbi:hypothetical protein [Nocardioides solisilvae]|uniref:hypothetical protein n=1 Tax=Nocardioides solisilvae TaxID=1542435 RepID=UPI000D74D3D6|nr:hypothetical protein [Nocardioides solisilvae]